MKPYNKSRIESKMSFPTSTPPDTPPISSIPARRPSIPLPTRSGSNGTSSSNGMLSYLRNTSSRLSTRLYIIIFKL